MDKSLGTFFQCTLAEPLPLPPQTTLNACIHNFFPSLKILYGGGGRTVRKVRRACAGYEGNQKEALPPWCVVARVGRYSPASRLPLLAQKRLLCRLSVFRRTPWRMFHHVCRQISFIRQITSAKQPRVIFTGWYSTSFIFNAQGLSPWTFSSVWEPCDGLTPMTIVEVGTTYSPWRDIFLPWKTETFPSSVRIHSIAQTC